MAPVTPKPEHVRHFPDRAAFEAWLAANHDREIEIWLKIHKKGSGLPTVTVVEALDVALCWGWIDGLRKSLDDTSFLQRYTPRRPKSRWSQINREHVKRLIADGRMTPHGQKQVDDARADGRWESAYASGSKMEFPADLLAAIEARPKAAKFFQTLNAANRYALVFRTDGMKTAAGREKKIKSFVDMLERGETLYPNGSGARKDT